MARQRSLHLVLGFACSLAAVGCDDSDDGQGKFGMLDSGVLVPPGSTAGAGGTTGPTAPGGMTGTSAPGGTTGTSALGGTTGVSVPGGTTGMSSPGGTTGVSVPGGTTGMSAPGGTTGMSSPGGGGMGPPPPATLSAANGPLGSGGGGVLGGGGNTFELPNGVGTVHYPDPAKATGKWPGVALVPGFLNSGPEMADWGPFLASWGIVAVITNSGALDTPDYRAEYLANAISGLKAENEKSGSPLYQKMSGAYGTSGYSMGGGGTSLASSADPSLRASVGLAPWYPTGDGITTPTLHFCGGADIVAPCNHASDAYTSIPASTPKMFITINSCDHLLCWFGPNDTPEGISGGWALAWYKFFLEKDERWLAPLLKTPAGSTMETNMTMSTKPPD